MLEREIEEKICQWITGADKRCLLVTGARQVGRHSA